MAKLVISMNGVNVRDYVLDRSRLSIGRNSVNDIVLNEPVVSGEHAALQNEAGEVSITDLGSTNGTFVNGKPVKKCPLHHNDVITIGNHELRYVDNAVQDFASTVVLHQASDKSVMRQSALMILNGPRAGENMPITKERTALGKPGVQVAVIVQKGDGYELLAVPLKGVAVSTRLNGKVLGPEPQPLSIGDEIEIADVRLAFMQ